MKEQTEEHFRAVVTVVGQDQVGIIAAVASLLAKYQVNIEDISQTIIQGVFNMIMLVDADRATGGLSNLKSELSALGEELHVQILIQHTAIFDKMHRI